MVGVHGEKHAEVGIGVLVEGSQGVMVDGGMLVDEYNWQEAGCSSQGSGSINVVGHTLLMNG